MSNPKVTSVHFPLMGRGQMPGQKDPVAGAVMSFPAYVPVDLLTLLLLSIYVYHAKLRTTAAQ